MSVKYQCKECSTGCEIVVPSETYEPYECPSYSSYCDWKRVEDAQQDTAEETKTAGNKQGTAIAKIAADLLRGIMARTLFSAESQASIVSEFQRQLSSVA